MPFNSRSRVLCIGLIAAFSASCGGSSDVVEAPPATLFAAGDSAYCALGISVGQTPAAKTAALIGSLSTTAEIVTLGDNVYDNGSAADFANCYNPTWGPLSART